MTIYIEFKKSKLRAMIGTEEIEIIVPLNFYSLVPRTESYYMFGDDETNVRLKDLVDRHRNRLGLFGKIRYWFFRNSVFSLVDKEAQDLATVEQIYAYATLILDARVIWIIKKPETFNSTNLKDIDKIKHTYINRGQIKAGGLISKINMKH